MKVMEEEDARHVEQMHYAASEKRAISSVPTILILLSWMAQAPQQIRHHVLIQALLDLIHAETCAPVLHESRSMT